MQPYRRVILRLAHPIYSERLDANDTEYFDLHGASINDPIIENEIIEFEGSGKMRSV